jgi:hypothetical protein
MFHANAERWAEISKEERNGIHAACGAWHAELDKNGHTRSAAALQPPDTATTVRENGGKVVITDGPFAETKEVLGGFEILECKDLDEAIAIAKRFPALRVGYSVEIRPLIVGPCED